MTQNSEPWLSPLRVADLKTNRDHDILLTPDTATRQALAESLDLLDLRKLRLEGVLKPLGKKDWRFTGKLGATVVQPCVVTLEPVTTRLDVVVERNFIAGYEHPDPGSETEMDQDDTSEPLREVIDPGQIMAESLALALPDYPRAEDAEAADLVFTEPGETPMTDQEARPFAQLAGLRDKLAGNDPEKG